MNKFLKKMRFIYRNCDRIIKQQYYISKNRYLINSDRKSFPLSSFQERFFYLEKMNQKDSSNTVKLLLSYSGDVNDSAAIQAINIIVKHNDILRTTFVESEGELRQVVHDEVDPAIYIHELSGKVSLLEYDEFVSQLAKKTFDLGKLPLFEIHILKHDDKIDILTNFHHLIWDGWSQYQFYKEFSSIYNALLRGEDYQYQPRPQYKAYATIEEKYSNSNLTKTVEFYKSYLKNYEEVELGFQGEKSSSKNESDVILIPIRGVIIAKAKSASKFMNCTLNEFFLAAFIITLHVFSKQESISVMIPRFNRFHPTFQKMYGPMLNALPIISTVNPGMSFAGFVQTVSKTIKKLCSFDETPIDKIFSTIKKDEEFRGKSFDFQFLFNYISPEWANQVDLPGLKLHKERLIIPELGHSMTVYISGDNSNGDMGITFAYQKSKMSRQSAELFLKEYLQVVEMISLNHGANIQSLRLSSEISKKISSQLSAPIDRVTFIPIVSRALKSVLDNQNGVFLKQGDSSYTYRDLLGLIQLYFGRISTYVERRNQVVTIVGKRDIHFYASMIAVMAHGQTVYLLDENKSHAEIDSLLDCLAPKIIVANDSKLTHIFQNGKYDVVDIRDSGSSVICDIADVIATADGIQADDTAYIVSTSGSTGVPKLIKGSQEGLAHFISWQKVRFDISNDDCCAQLTNVGFDVVYREIFTPIISGATLSLPVNNLWVDELDFAAWFKTDKVTFLHTVPSVLDVVIKSFLNCHQVILPDLRYLFIAGEPLSDYLITAWKHATYSNVTFVNLYGPSETTLAKSYYIVPSIVSNGIQPIGSAIDQAQVYISRDDMSPCIPFERGQIIIRTPYRSQGYLGVEESRFINNPFTNAPDDSLYQTGDYGHLDTNGLVHIHGRIDDQVKVNGVKFHLNAIEQQLVQLPGVSECAVIQEQSLGGKYIAAFIVPSNHALALSKSSIVSMLHDVFPDYMTPNRFYYIDQIPKTHSGKKNRVQLKGRSSTLKEITDDVVMPVSETERLIHDVWVKIIARSSVSVTDSYKQLGINSLNAVRCLLEINNKFKTNLTLIDLAKNETIRKLSSFIDAGETRGRMSGVDKVRIGDLKKHLVDIDRFDTNTKDINNNINILITGVTGFLGGYIFKYLIETCPDKKLYLLIRSNSTVTSLDRLKSVCEDLKIDFDFHKDRINIIDADFSRCNFGLTDEVYNQLAASIDTIIHCGALVNFTSPIAELKSANIDGTYEVIRFSVFHHIKPISYISTAGIIPSTKEISKMTITETMPIDFGDDVEIYGGYAQSKWVAEYAIQEAYKKGLPVKIYRVGRVAGDSNTGMWPENDFIFSFIRTVNELRVAPDISVKIDLIPVDVAARMIVAIHEDTWNEDICFHMVNPNKLCISELAASLSSSHNKVIVSPYSDWRSLVFKAIKQGNQLPLSPFLHLLPENIDDLPRLKYERHLDVRNTKSRLVNTSVDFPVIDKQIICKYLAYTAKRK